MYCPQCGTPLLENSSFCRTCSSIVEPFAEKPDFDLDEDGDLTPIGKHGVVDKKRKDSETVEEEQFVAMVPSKPPTAETAAARANTIAIHKGVLIAVGVVATIALVILAIVFIDKPNSEQPASNASSSSAEASETASSSAESSSADSQPSPSAASQEAPSGSAAAEPLSNNQSPEYDIPTTTPVTDPFFGVWILSTRSEQEATAIAREATSKGLYGTVFVAAEWSNLKPEPRFMVAAGYSHTEGEAYTLCEKAKRAGYAEAYVQYSGDYKG